MNSCRFNQHSILVLKASEQSEKEQSLTPNITDPVPQKRVYHNNFQF